MRTCYLLAIAISALLGCICAERYGTISVVGPAFVNREVTLKVTPFLPWGCDVEWRYVIEGGTQFETMNDAYSTRHTKDGSFFLKWWAPLEYNRSDFYAGCSTNKTIKTSVTSINMKDIVGKCGALVLLSPVVYSADVKLGYFPSDYSIQHYTFTGRTWTKNIQDIPLREGSYEEETVSAYLYILTIFNFEKRHEGTYMLDCNSGGRTDSVQIHIPEPPSYPVIGPKSINFNTTECIDVYGGSQIYCNTENGTKPVQVVLLLGHDSFILAESKRYKGLYLFSNIHQQMDGLARREVTCQVSNAALATSYEAHSILCSVDSGIPPVLTVPEFLYGESSTAICKVHNTIPATALEILVDNVVLSDVEQTDSFNGSSHTFTSTAKVTKTNRQWNGKEMCCTRKSTVDFGIADHSVCKNISIKYPPSDISMSVSKLRQEYEDKVSFCFIYLSCETNESNPPCAIEWSSNIDDLRYINSGNWSNGEHGSYTSVSKVIYKVSKDMEGGTITCITRCDNFSSHLTQNYTVSFSTGPTLYLNTTSPVDLPRNTNVIVKCSVLDNCDANGPYTHWWEDENSTVIKICHNTDECLLTLNYAGDGERIYTCNSVNSEKKSLKVLSSVTKEPTTKKLHMSVLYAVSGTVIVLLLTTFSVLLCRRCKPHVYETLIRLRRPTVRERSTHVYDDVQSHIETTALHNLGGVSTRAIENKDAPPLLDMEVRSNENVSHYDYVATPSAQSDRRTNSPDANYIHAV